MFFIITFVFIMIFTALSFLHIYGLFLMRRKCQLDYMLNGHWSTQDSGREGVILSLCYLSVSLCNPLSNIQFWIWNFYLIIFIAAHVITRLLLWELAFDWMGVAFYLRFYVRSCGINFSQINCRVGLIWTITRGIFTTLSNI